MVVCCTTWQVRQVAAGGMHSVALTDDGQIWTTGVNDEGALGRETGDIAHVPGMTHAAA